MIRKYKAWRERVRYEKARDNAMFRASNGEHLPRLEREQLNLPDWTG
jgi:hypothetical protein